MFPESRRVLGAKFARAYIISTGASKYIKIVRNHYPPNFQNFPKLCITFKLFSPQNMRCSLWSIPWVKSWFLCFRFLFMTYGPVVSMDLFNRVMQIPRGVARPFSVGGGGVLYTLFLFTRLRKNTPI